MQSGRLLKLGIVGEVKAGKSSFLNALIFEGKEVLPKAPTPMTAALTRVSYSELPMTKIVFYDVDDWNIILTNSSKYDEKMDEMYERYMDDCKLKYSCNKKGYSKSQNVYNNSKLSRNEFEKLHRLDVANEYKACKELTDLVKKNCIDVENFLGREKIIKGTSPNDYAYLNELNQFVGAEGKYTAIVKYTEVKVANKLLEGIEIIDTPGLNDPISSRSRSTKEFLIECDAIFLIGYCGQFLAAEDMNLIMSILPDEGINNVALIGSKLDSAILQYPGRNVKFKNAYLGTISNCVAQAKENINSCEINMNNRKILEQIKESEKLYCVSSLAYLAGMQMKNGEPFDKQTKHLIESFKNRFSDFNVNEDTLLGLSSIFDVKEKVFKDTKEKKYQIIQERTTDVINSQKGKFLRILEDIANQSRITLNDLKKGDCQQLEEKLTVLKERLDSIRIVVKNLFENAAIESRRNINDIATEVGINLSNYSTVEVHSVTNTEHRSSTSGHLWWKKEHCWEEHTTTYSVKIKDVETNMRNYYYACIDHINSSFRELIKIDELKNNVKLNVTNAFDCADKEFDENKIIMPLDNALNRITLPEVTLNLKKYEKILDSEISGFVQNGIVKNEYIPNLDKAQNRILQEMAEDFIKEIKQQGEIIDNNLQIQAGVFIDNIIAELEKSQNKFEELIKDKEMNIDKMESFLSVINQSKKSLMGV